MRLRVCKLLADQVQRTACPEPLDLLLVVGMVQLHLVRLSILMVQHHRQLLARREVGGAGDIDYIIQ